MAFLLKCMSKGARFIKLSRRYSLSPPIVFSDEVIQAKVKGQPLVALESTIITHGMPYPKNLETAIQVESIIRSQGAVPATIAILRGQLTVGLTQDQLEYLAQAKGVVKASRRDLAPVAAAELDGATTVAGTIIAAELADIPIFVTGGIGGVHREGETTLDVSADLNELGRSKTLVVCGGVKSILDIGRTLEYLETQGVCVCAFGDTNDFPAFYTPRSGFHAPHRVSNPIEAARVLNASRKLGLSSGIVVAVPIPKEYAADESKIEEAISKALDDAKQNGIHGKDVTPFILAAVAKATDGASLDANIALIKNNAKVGADIAVQYKKLEKDSIGALNIGFGAKRTGDSRRCFHTSCERRDVGGSVEKEDGDIPLLPAGHTDGDVLVIGGANVDRTYRTTVNVHLDGSTHPCQTDQCGGGVGRNIAEALWRLRGGRTRLLTAVGDDADGQYLADIAPGLLLDGCVIKNARTATYAAVMGPKGDCLLGLGDMTLHDHITVELVNKHIQVLEQAPLVVIDGNLPEATLEHVLRVCHHVRKPEKNCLLLASAVGRKRNSPKPPPPTVRESHDGGRRCGYSGCTLRRSVPEHETDLYFIQLFFEPTDRRKAAKPLKAKQSISYSSPNLNELRAMVEFLTPNINIEPTNDINEVLKLAKIVSKAVDFIIVTTGDKGVVTIKKSKRDSSLVARMYPVEAIENVENVSGAGDCFTSGFICGILSQSKESTNVHTGFQAAKSALLSKNTVPFDLSLDKISINEAKYVTLKIH